MWLAEWRQIVQSLIKLLTLVFIYLFIYFIYLFGDIKQI